MHARFSNDTIVSESIGSQSAIHIVLIVVCAFNLVFRKLTNALVQVLVLARQYNATGWENSLGLLVAGREVLLDIVLIIFRKLFLFFLLDQLTSLFGILRYLIEEGIA